MTTGYTRPRLRANDVAQQDNRLTFMDQASFLALRARDQPQLVQWVWHYERGIDFDGLRQFHHDLGYGLLGRLIERSPLPFGRHRWVAAHRGHDIDVAADARPRSELNAWADEHAQLPVDPEWGPGWRLGVLPLTDGSAAVSLVASHCLVDGLGCGAAISDAINGIRNELGYPPPGARSRRRATWQDARETLRGVPEVGRAVRAAVKLVRRQQDDFARLGGSRQGPVGDGTDRVGGVRYVTVPAITIHVDQKAWDAKATALGGTSNSLFTAFAAKLGERMGRQCAADGTVRVIITASARQEHDTSANALAFTSIHVDPDTVTTDLSGVRNAIRTALVTLSEHPDEALELLPLTPLTPKRAVRKLGDVLFAFPDLPVTCTNIGDIDPELACVDGTPADSVFARGVDQKVTPQLVEQKFFLGSGRIGGKVFITAIAYHLGHANSKSELSRLAQLTLAEFELTATIN